MNQRAAWDETFALIAKSPLDNVNLPPSLRFPHLHNMDQRLEDTFSEAKIGRWLGWLQAAVVANGIATMEEMKEINRKHA